MANTLSLYQMMIAKMEFVSYDNVLFRIVLLFINCNYNAYRLNRFYLLVYNHHFKLSNKHERSNGTD